MKILLACLIALLPLPAQESATEAEERELGYALAEAGNSPVDFIRAIEKHLEKHPDAERRPELERALVKAAMETKDNARIVLYGERVLARESDDVQVLDRVARALLATDAADTSARALKYARRYAELVAAMRKEDPPGRMGRGQWQEDLDRTLARALALESRATGNLGKIEEAVAVARKSYEAFPNVEGAREIARWLARAGKEEEAAIHLADAFVIPDARVAEADRARDRARMGELYSKAKGSEKGLGDLVLEAWDRTAALLAARRLRLRESDPNAQLTNLMEFTLSGPGGRKLQLSSLRGKTVVMDFWATWCGPCRTQQPLYEEVRKQFEGDEKVAFLSINTDEERERVVPFLEANQWSQQVWFEDGLARLFQISSIPTTIVIDPRGQVASRMNGFVPERFVEMLAERIRGAK